MHREIGVKDFSGTAAPRNLKFGTSIDYQWLYCVHVSESQHSQAYHFLNLSLFFFLHFSFPPIEKFVKDFSAPSYFWTENKNADIYFCLLFLFFPFPIFHSNAVYTV